MTDDLVKRLRGWRGFHQANLSIEAADRIEALTAHYKVLWEANLRIGIERDALTADNARLLGLLRNLADEYANPFNESEGPSYNAARAALKGETP